MKENEKKMLTIAGMLIGAIILIILAGVAWRVSVGEQPTSKASSGPDEIIRFEKNEFTVDEDGNKIFTDGILSATFNKKEGTLAFSGKGTVTSHQDWVDLEGEKKFVRTIIFQDGITSIDDCEFSELANYVNLEFVVFEGDVNVIGEYAFTGNRNLQKVEFKGKCRKIEVGAFFECYTLEEIEIPEECNVHPWAFKETPLEPEEETEEWVDEQEEPI